MPAHRVRRKTADGRTRWHVRAVIGGRREHGGRVIHLGAFATAKEADACIEYANLELAAGRIPDRRALLARRLGETRTLRDAGVEWLATRVDLAESSRHSYEDIILRNRGSRLDVWRLRPEQVRVEDVQRFVEQLVTLGAAPRTIATKDVAVLRQVLDHAGVDPNPARDRRIRLPKHVEAAPDPPTASQVAAIIRHASPKHRLAIALLEATGMRVGELCDLRWGDVDTAESRFRIARGKTRLSRRFVDVPAPLMEEVLRLVPFDDRRIDQRVLGLTRNSVNQAMRRACQAAGIPHFHPHDLRHRHASVRIARGESVLVVQRDLGHAKASMTSDTYGHVVTDGGWGWESAGN
jgi:integrase